ncbi:hypothetical protein [Salibacterium halotolerans]|uniref:Uncharacterized protein n=1 Tax=Salibacterium halotolerans TaxID=1884432 RepID=A0A1I5SX50_9BACI|nr:hypothetical protein [Salibacterium halotolerans]SFP75309.1 hypothetical protein SAMN05518683_109130 [Salibacterium halotolerans]
MSNKQRKKGGRELDEPFESYHHDHYPFQPVNHVRVDSWKRAVQDVISDVTAQVLYLHPDERTCFRLIERFKAAWFSRISADHFSHETSYYLHLIQISGHLLPLLEGGSGTLAGWLKYQPAPGAEETLTVPVVKQADRLKLYVFETDPAILSRLADMAAYHVLCSSALFPDLLEIDSAGDGHSSIHTLSSFKRKQDG